MDENKDYWGDDFTLKISNKELKRALVAKHLGKLCTCKNRTVIIDEKNRRLECSECGAPIDPYKFIGELALKEHLLWQHLKALREEIETLEKWKLNNRMGQTLRHVASYLRRNMIPLCPHCREPFELEQIKSWTSKEYAIKLAQAKLLNEVSNDR